MDPLTHLASGLVVGNLIKRDQDSKWALPFCMAMAAAPDLDIIFAANSEWMLLYRRAVTHSIFTAPLLALFGLWIGKRIFPTLKPVKIYLLSLGLILLHMFFDVINSYGTQLLWPFSDHRFEWHLVYIIDPVFTIGLLTFGILGFLKPTLRQKLSVAGLAFCFAYPALCFGIREMARKEVQLDGVKSEVLPDAFSPFFWKVIDERNAEVGTYLSLRLWSIFAGYQTLPTDLRWTKTQWAPELQTDMRTPSFIRTYAWFASYGVTPIESGRRTGNLYEDLRFVSAHEWLRKSRGSAESKTPSPFSLFVEYGILDDKLPGVTRLTFNDKVIYDYAHLKH